MKRIDEYLIVGLVALFYAISLATWSFGSSWGGCCDLYLRPAGEHFFTPVFTNTIFLLLNGVASDAFLAVSFQIILPVINFILVYQIMVQVVSWRWSLTLSLLGASLIPEYAFRDFIFDIILLNQPNLPGSSPTAIYYPLPNIALFFFLLGFIAASQKVFYSISRAFLVTGFLALLMYVHALGAAFLITFWFVRYAVRCSRQGAKVEKIIFNLGLQLILFIVICLPGLITLNTHSIEVASTKVSVYYLLIYLIAPLALLAVVSRIKRVDMKEIWFRFSSIYALLVLEFLFLSIDVLNILPINFDYLSQGIGQSLLHQLYYAPCICFMSRSGSGYKSTAIDNETRQIVLRKLESSFEFAERYLLQFIIALLLVYNLKWVYF